VPRPRIEPLQAIGTVRAVPRPSSTRLDRHTLYILYLLFHWTRVSPLGTEFPLSIVYTVNHRVKLLFIVCTALLVFV
jgi:hypothetical protein